MKLAEFNNLRILQEPIQNAGMHTRPFIISIYKVLALFENCIKIILGAIFSATSKIKPGRVSVIVLAWLTHKATLQNINTLSSLYIKTKRRHPSVSNDS